jgi:hypothetical protein
VGGSLDSNALCGLNLLDRGTYTAEGILKIAEALKINTSITSIRQAERFPMSAEALAPIDDCFFAIAAVSGATICAQRAQGTCLGRSKSTPPSRT